MSFGLQEGPHYWCGMVEEVLLPDFDGFEGGIQNPRSMMHVNCACTKHALRYLLVASLVFPKVGSHLTKCRRIHSTTVAPLGCTWQPMLSCSGKVLKQWSESWGAWESGSVVDMALRLNLAFCHEFRAVARGPGRRSSRVMCVLGCNVPI